MGRRRACEPGDHLVGHSYGGVIALLAAAAVGERLASLTVIEPPCTSVALDDPAVAAFAEGGAAFWRDGPRDDPEAFLRGFLASVGSDFDPPSPLPPALERGARALIAERGPWEAEIPLARLAALDLPDARRLGRAPPRLRRDLRRARARARRRAPRRSRVTATTRSSTRAFTGALLDFVARGAPRDD